VATEIVERMKWFLKKCLIIQEMAKESHHDGTPAVLLRRTKSASYTTIKRIVVKVLHIYIIHKYTFFSWIMLAVFQYIPIMQVDPVHTNEALRLLMNLDKDDNNILL